jgi:hypothetical protein
MINKHKPPTAVKANKKHCIRPTQLCGLTKCMLLNDTLLNKTIEVNGNDRQSINKKMQQLHTV